MRQNFWNLLETAKFVLLAFPVLVLLFPSFLSPSDSLCPLRVAFAISWGLVGTWSKTTAEGIVLNDTPAPKLAHAAYVTVGNMVAGGLWLMILSILQGLGRCGTSCC